MKGKNLKIVLGIVLVCSLLFASCRENPSELSLAGKWEFAMDSTDVGVAEEWHTRSFADKIRLPGTTDAAGFGTPHGMQPSVGKPQILHLTRKNSYVGVAWYGREVTIPSEWEGKKVELELERVIWQTSVWVDGKPVAGKQESLVAPHRFDLTDYLTPGKHRIAIRVDNRKQYDISANNMGHAYTNETQIMWNGILGDMTLSAKDDITVEDLQVYPDVENRRIRVKGKLTNRGLPVGGELETRVREKAGGKPIAAMQQRMEIPSGETEFDFYCAMGDCVRNWSESAPVLYELGLTVRTGQAEAAAGQAVFGMREIGRDSSGLLLNGKKIFLRGTLECCVFPLTGCPPTTEKEWLKVFHSAREWGLNHLRFHSWCPPGAAFRAADSLGFYLQVELPLWSLSVGQDSSTNRFLYDEAARIIKEYGNHPSFCFFSLGNELQPDFRFLGKLLDSVKAADSRHLYTTTSFTFEGGHGSWPERNDDYFVTQWTQKGWVRGQGVFEAESPRFDKDYSAAVEGIPVPLITHEIGQYAVYPALKEIEKYTGVLDPLNFKGVEQDLKKKGLSGKADDYLQASGRLAALLYKEEIERAMKTPGISGFQLLDLHDFPGQGTALVGLLDAFWESKGVAKAEEFRQFSSAVVPLARFSKAVYTHDEPFRAGIEVANYGTEDLEDRTIYWTLTDRSGNFLKHGNFSTVRLPIGGGNFVGEIVCPLDELEKAGQLKLTVGIEGSEYKNTWKIWVYPASLAIEPGDVVVTGQLAEAKEALEAGKKVLFNPPYRQYEGIQGKFLPVFWSPVHFPKQAGTMGLLLDPDHRAFADFPTDGHTDWQWWRLVTQSRTWVVDSFYRQITPLVESVDNFVNNRRLCSVFEANCLDGKLLVCSMDLLNRDKDSPEKRQLLYSFLNYMRSEAFVPGTTVDFDRIESLVVPSGEK